MHPATLPIGLLLATFASVTAAPVQMQVQPVPQASDQDELDRYRTQLANMSPRAPQTPADGAIAA